jgi:hypothetical protein
VSPGGLTHTQKRKLLRMHAREKKELESKWQRDEFFNNLRPMMPRQQWRDKVVSEVLKEARVEATEEQEAPDAEILVETEVNRSDRPATPVGPADEGYVQDQSD